MGRWSGSGRRSRLASSAALALACAGVLLPGPAQAARESGAPTAAAGVLVVDAERCHSPARATGTRYVCTVAQAAPLLTDGARLVLAPGMHRGPLDLRHLRGVRVSGEGGAVLDAAGGRFALSLRDVRDVQVSALQLRGGTAQTVWVERTSGVVLDRVVVTGSRGSGLQLRDSSGLRLSRSRVTAAAAAGVMELTGVAGSTYERLVVSGNGRGAATHNGDGLQLSGNGVVVRDVEVVGNGSDKRFEHGIYVSARARSVLLSRVTSRGNSGVAVKLGGTGVLERSTLTAERTALYCGTTAGAGWTVRTTTLHAPRPVATDARCGALRRL
jgi:hypothetical protein